MTVSQSQKSFYNTPKQEDQPKLGFTRKVQSRGSSNLLDKPMLRSTFAITTKQGLFNITGSPKVASAKDMGRKQTEFRLNHNSNLHYRGVRKPGLVTYAVGGDIGHILPPDQRK